MRTQRGSLQVPASSPVPGVGWASMSSHTWDITSSPACTLERKGIIVLKLTLQHGPWTATTDWFCLHVLHYQCYGHHAIVQCPLHERAPTNWAPPPLYYLRSILKMFVFGSQIWSTYRPF